VQQAQFRLTAVWAQDSIHLTCIQLVGIYTAVQSIIEPIWLESTEKNCDNEQVKRVTKLV